MDDGLPTYIAECDVYLQRDLYRDECMRLSAAVGGLEARTTTLRDENADLYRWVCTFARHHSECPTTVAPRTATCTCGYDEMITKLAALGFGDPERNDEPIVPLIMSSEER